MNNYSIRVIVAIIILLISNMGCSKIEGNKNDNESNEELAKLFAKEFVRALEFKGPFLMSSDFFVSEYSPDYEKWTISNAEGDFTLYPETQDTFLDNFEDYNFWEIQIKDMDIKEKFMTISAYATIKHPNPIISNHLKGRRQIKIIAKYGSEGWKATNMAIMGIY